MARNSDRDQYAVIVPTITVDTSAYAQYDAVGNLGLPPGEKCIRLRDFRTGKGPCRASGLPAKLVHVQLTENGGQTPALTLYFFREMPHGTFTDNSAIVWGDEDYKRRCGCVRVVSGDWHTNPSTAANAFADVSGTEQIMDPAPDSEDIWLLIVADSAYDAVAAGDLVIEFKFDRGFAN